MPRQTTDERILRAFLALAASRGMAAVTTRDLARAAGVNEVTIFRRFGDKASLALAAVRRFQPVDAIEAYRPAIDVSTTDSCLAGLAACLHMLYRQLVSHPELVQFGLADAARHPEVLDEVKRVPDAARRLLTEALHQASPLLRADCDVNAEVLGLLGMLLLLATWRARDWLRLTDRQAETMLAARLRPLLRQADRAV
jgi:AcrR family transcriptional regulator